MKCPRLTMVLLLCSSLMMIAAISLVVPSCTSQEEVDAARAAAVDQRLKADADAKQTAEISTALQAQLRAVVDGQLLLQRQMSDMDVNSAAYAQAVIQNTAATATALQLSKDIDTANGKHDTFSAQAADWDRKIAAADKALKEADDPNNPLVRTSNIAGSVWPWASLLTTTGLAGSLWKNLRLSKAKGILTDGLTGIVKSIDVLAGISPEVAAAIQQNAKQVSQVQGTVGKALVDQVQDGVKPDALKIAA